MKHLIVTAIASILIAGTAAAKLNEPKDYIGRFVYETGAPELPEHRNPLKMMYEARFTATATYRQAIKRLLEQAGYSYRYNPDPSQATKLETWLDKPLAPMHRKLGKMEIDRSIRIMIGAGWNLDVDEMEKSVAIKTEAKD